MTDAGTDSPHTVSRSCALGPNAESARTARLNTARIARHTRFVSQPHQ
jgi:hypothetical protein